jgi:metal-responsive CopG/Arc/MetJ family transcriptional regulator
MASGHSDRVTIKIPRKLYENLKVIIKDSGFSSVTEFIVYVLRDLAASKEIGEDLSLTRREVEVIRSRLKSLGYL